jgi:hypothetical protein
MEQGKERGEYRLRQGGSTSSKIYIREKRLNLDSIDHRVNPFRDWATVVDCGDIANTPFDKLVAVNELEKGMKVINEQKPKNETASSAVRLITIGGDHTISRPSIIVSSWGFSDLASSFTNLACSSLDMGSSSSLAL